MPGEHAAMNLVPCPRCDEEVPLASGRAPDACPRCGHPLVFVDRFRLTRLLGRGGTGLVYGAVDEQGGPAVALKMVSARPGSADWQVRDLFEAGSRLLQGLRHPGLPRVLAFGELSPGRLALVREDFVGGTLEERIARQGLRLEPARVRSLLERLLELLAYLQSLSPPVIHRDIKPANIMFRTAGDWEPVLVDFDTIAPPPEQRSGLTVVATLGYAAPEQFAGEANTSTDLYAVGATMLFAVTHVEPDRLPRRDDRFDVADRLAALDAATRRVLLRLVEPSSTARYGRAEEALRDLRSGKAPAEAAPPAAAAGASPKDFDRALMSALVAVAGREQADTGARGVALSPAEAAELSPEERAELPELLRLLAGDGAPEETPRQAATGVDEPPVAGLEALARRGREERERALATERARAERAAAPRTGVPLKARLATTALGFLGATSFVFTIGMLGLIVGLLLGLAVLAPPSVGLAFGLGFALPVVLGGSARLLAVLLGRRTWRREETWLASRPFQVQRYPEALDQRAIPAVVATIDFAQRVPDLERLADAVRGLGPSHVAVEIFEVQERQVMFSAQGLGFSGEWPRGARRWLRRLIDEVLVPQHATHPIRFVRFGG